ncbi:hypothetical protein, partial [Aeromonas veronii]|uniref:hypothetical protein n=1 Tax=Aeromonas veronii TaxID=654 RepID=UPI000CCE080A
DLGNVSDSGSLSRYSKSTVRRHRRVSHFEVEFAGLPDMKNMKFDGDYPYQMYKKKFEKQVENITSNLGENLGHPPL